MPFGEMTITLDDVGTLLGIPVMGLFVHTSTSMRFTEQVDLLERGLGVDKASASAELSLACGGIVRMGWIKQVCGNVTPASPVEESWVYENIQLLRERLDALHPSEVAWDLYTSVRAQHPFQQISFFCGCLRSLDFIEPYHPHRVLRQFGYVQTFPPTPLAPIRASRGSTVGKYKVSYRFLDQYWITWEDHVLSLAHRGHRAQHAWKCTPDYVEWFTRISHSRVQNSDHHSHYDPNEGRDYPTPRTNLRARDQLRATLA